MDLKIFLLFISIYLTFQVFKSRTPAYILISIIYLSYLPSNNRLTKQEAIGLYILPIFIHFYFSRPWIQFALYQIIVTLILWYFCNCDFIITGANVFLTVPIFICLKKDFQHLDYIFSFYRKSDLLFQNLWAKSNFISFIIDKNGVVLHKNLAGDELIKSRTVKSKNSKELELEQILRIPDLPSFISKIFKGEEPEEEMFKHTHLEKLESFKEKDLSYLIKGEKVTWGGGNCAAIYLADISLIRARRMMLIECIRMVQVNADKFMKKVLDNLRHEIDAETVVGFFNVSQLLRDAMVLKSRFFCRYEPRYEHFDVNTEVLNAVEVLFLKACSGNVTVLYTKEQGVPQSVIGDKVLHFQIIYSMLHFILENCVPGSEVSVFLQVYSLVKYDITLIYKFTFMSNKITNISKGGMFQSQNYNCSKESVHELSELLNTFGLGITAVNNILLFLRGGILQVQSESDLKKITINLTLPFNTGKKEVSHSKLKISPNTFQDSNLTTKWYPIQQKLIKRALSLKDSSLFSEDFQDFPIILTSSIQTYPKDKKKIREIWSKEELLNCLNEETECKNLGIKKTLMVITKNVENVKEYFSNEFLVEVCDNKTQAERVLMRYFEYHVQFSAVLVEEISQEMRNLIDFIEKIEENCYLKTPVFWFRGF